MSAPSGAGIAAAQEVAQKKVEAVITGNIGPNASQVLSHVGIQMVTGASGTVRKAVEDFKSGALKGSAQIASSGGFPEARGGFGVRRGIGIGGGGGRGMGRGMGMRGMRRASYSYEPSMPVQPNSANQEQEIEILSKHMEELERQLKEVKKRLEELK
jgi:predicted Fe-Mo cluster-binding NifX family protein